MSDASRAAGEHRDRYIGREDPGEAERLAAQHAGGLDELGGALALCTLPARPRVLDIGCGAGDFTQALLRALPAAQVTAVDLNERLLAEARRKLGADAGPAGRVHLARADAAALPYAARTYDLVTGRFVLMHQADPATVTAEMHRVTATGGYALAIEPDWGARALYPDSEALAALLDLARRGRPYGFPDVFVGRKLFGMLRAAGFMPVHLRPTAFVLTADDLARSTASDADSAAASGTRASLGPERLLEQGRPLLRTAGLITDAELDALILRLAAVTRSPDYCSAGVDLAAVAHKPFPRLTP